jgi:predicted 3-demethylubiquinone-9 3-methyltransferase (glyoxalase superfamily)
MQKITPFLWFDGNAEEAMNFYTSVFKNAKVGNISRYGEAGPGPAGSVLTASFELEGLEFTALNGGPHFKFNEAISFHVACESQAEVDYFWDGLGAGGQIQQCGWLKDKFGVSWQIVPTALPRLLGNPDRAKANRVMQAMLEMKKLDIAALERAAA